MTAIAYLFNINIDSLISISIIVQIISNDFWTFVKHCNKDKTWNCVIVIPFQSKTVFLSIHFLSIKSQDAKFKFEVGGVAVVACDSLPLGQCRQTTIHTHTHTYSHTVGRTCKLQWASRCEAAGLTTALPCCPIYSQSFTLSVIQRFLRRPTIEVCTCDNPNFLSSATFYKTGKEALDSAFICPSTSSLPCVVTWGKTKRPLPVKWNINQSMCNFTNSATVVFPSTFALQQDPTCVQRLMGMKVLMMLVFLNCS